MYGAPPPPQGRGRGLLPNVPPYQQPVAAHPHYPPPPPSSYNPPFDAAYRPIAGPAPAPHLGAPVNLAPPPPGIGGRPGSSSSGFSGASSVHSGSSAGHFVGGFHSPAPGPVGPPVVVAPRNASFSGPSGYPPGQAPGTPIHPAQLPYGGSPSLQVAPPPRSPSAPPYNPVTPPTAHTATMGPVMTQGRPSPAQAHGFGYSPGQFVTPPRGPTSSQGHGRHSSSDLGHGVPSSVSMPGHGRFGSFSGGPDSRVPSGVYASPASMPSQMQGRRASEGGASAGGGHGGGPRDTSHLTLTLPDVPRLEDDRGRALASGDPRRQLRWATDVVKFVERKGDAARPTEPPLVQFIDEAIGIINGQAGGANPVAEALYLRGDLQASGSFPSYLRKDLRSAFNDFELAARMGWAPSWFRLGRDYEVLGDIPRAKIAYEHGASAGDVGSIYRLGMANLLGQLDIPVNYPAAIPLLRSAADIAVLDTPQPAYIYGMLLAGEFSHVPVPAHLLQPPPPLTLDSEARRRIEHAAYLHFVPAQYKLGWCYEHARLDCAYDPLLSVQWYSLASQGGEMEADMALSKWFLCGAEGCFDVDEALAFTFADKAARRGLPSAEFAIGYYYEVGVGTAQDLESARKWYSKAAAHDNADAKQRLAALESSSSQAISRKDHLTHVDTKLQHTRTIAKNRSQKAGRKPVSDAPPPTPKLNGNGDSNVAARKPSGDGIPNDLSRKKTMKMVHETAGVRAGLRRLAGRSKFESTDSAPPLLSTQIAPPTMGPSTSSSALHTPSSSSQLSGSGSNSAAGSRMSSQSYASGPGTLSQSSSALRQQRIPSGPLPPLPPGGSPALGPYGGGRRQSADQNAGRPAPGSYAGTPSASSSQTGASGNKQQPVVYESFEQMGFAPQKASSDKDCVIM